MPFYLFEVAYAPEAFRAMIANPSDRKAAASKLADACGGKVHDFFFAFGKYDAVVLVEAPDDATMAAVAMVVAGSGIAHGGRTTKLLTVEEAMGAMRAAGKAAAAYEPPRG